jgi:hypothetical protein
MTQQNTTQGVAALSAVQTDISPFKVNIPDEALADLRRRIVATRWPSKELVQDASQGVQQAMLQKLMGYWATQHDWRKAEAKLNALPQFTTEIDGVDIHFIHVKSQHKNALPLIITHGWPGSVIELLNVVGPLTDPTAHGGAAEDAFDLVLPSLPGFGFSGQPSELGWDPGRVGRAWAELMKRLGYNRYVAQGGDIGATSLTRWDGWHQRAYSASTSTSSAPSRSQWGRHCSADSCRRDSLSGSRLPSSPIGPRRRNLWHSMRSLLSSGGVTSSKCLNTLRR